MWQVLLPQWLMELPLRVRQSVLNMMCGRWNNHCQQVISIGVLRCQPEPHPIYITDGICQCSYLGMDYSSLYIHDPIPLDNLTNHTALPYITWAHLGFQN